MQIQKINSNINPNYNIGFGKSQQLSAPAIIGMVTLGAVSSTIIMLNRSKIAQYCNKLVKNDALLTAKNDDGKYAILSEQISTLREFVEKNNANMAQNFSKELSEIKVAFSDLLTQLNNNSQKGSNDDIQKELNELKSKILSFQDATKNIPTASFTAEPVQKQLLPLDLAKIVVAPAKKVSNNKGMDILNDRIAPNLNTPNFRLFENKIPSDFIEMPIDRASFINSVLSDEDLAKFLYPNQAIKNIYIDYFKNNTEDAKLFFKEFSEKLSKKSNNSEFNFNKVNEVETPDEFISALSESLDYPKVINQLLENDKYHQFAFDKIRGRNANILNFVEKNAKEKEVSYHTQSSNILAKYTDLTKNAKRMTTYTFNYDGAPVRKTVEFVFDNGDKTAKFDYQIIDENEVLKESTSSFLKAEKTFSNMNSKGLYSLLLRPTGESAVIKDTSLNPSLFDDRNSKIVMREYKLNDGTTGVLKNYYTLKNHGLVKSISYYDGSALTVTSPSGVSKTFDINSREVLHKFDKNGELVGLSGENFPIKVSQYNMGNNFYNSKFPELSNNLDEIRAELFKIIEQAKTQL